MTTPADKNYRNARRLRDVQPDELREPKQETKVRANRADYRKQWKADGREVKRKKVLPFDWEAFKRGAPKSEDDISDQDAIIDDILMEMYKHPMDKS